MSSGPYLARSTWERDCAYCGRRIPPGRRHLVWGDDEWHQSCYRQTLDGDTSTDIGGNQ